MLFDWSSPVWGPSRFVVVVPLASCLVLQFDMFHVLVCDDASLWKPAAAVMRAP